MIKNLPQIVLLNIVGLALFLSWYIPVNHGFWLPIDADIFYFFNQKLVESKAFLWLVALTNNRAFDGCSLLAMGMLMLSFWLKENAPGRRRIVIPGDHGMMLLIFSAFMWRYFGKVAGLIALIIFVVFAFPRVMIGAHWFTDIIVGSMTVILIGLPWVLLTPLSDRLITFFDKSLPGKNKHFQNK